jgi:hypothetical protein
LAGDLSDAGDQIEKSIVLFRKKMRKIEVIQSFGSSKNYNIKNQANAASG